MMQFNASGCFERMERAQIDIIESRNPIDKSITLWWGLDGLRLNEDGSIENIHRSNKTAINSGYGFIGSGFLYGSGLYGFCGGGGGCNSDGGQGYTGQNWTTI